MHRTVAKYRGALAEIGFLERHQARRSNYHINTALVRLFLDVSGGR